MVKKSQNLVNVVCERVSAVRLDSKFIAFFYLDLNKETAMNLVI